MNDIEEIYKNNKIENIEEGLNNIEIEYLQKRLLKICSEFYKTLNKDTIDYIISIMLSNNKKKKNEENIKIKQKSRISLRMLDWFATRYTKFNTIYIKLNNISSYFGEEKINIYNSYKANLKTYSKRYFDPFKRHCKIMFNFPFYNEPIETSYGQLIFFKWLLTYNILEYIEKNYDDLSEKMYQTNLEDKQNKVKKKLNKNQQINNNKQQDIIKYQPFILNF